MKLQLIAGEWMPNKRVVYGGEGMGKKMKVAYGNAI